MDAYPPSRSGVTQCITGATYVLGLKSMAITDLRGKTIAFRIAPSQ